MIRLFLSDGDPAPVPLVDIGDDDHALLLDVLDSDASRERRADGSPTGWVVDHETVAFLEWSRATSTLTGALRRMLATRAAFEVTWEEVG